MMPGNDHGEKAFVKISAAAERLGVPVAWLEREARDGRIPVLRAGTSLLCEVNAVHHSLSERTREVSG